MPAFLAFKAGAVVGAAALTVVRNRRVICKTLELAGSVQETLVGLCRSSRDQVARLFRPRRTEEPADGSIVSTAASSAEPTQETAS
jgi:hypothetical protein